MSDEQPKARPQSDQEAASQRAVGFVDALDARFRAAGIDHPIEDTVKFVAIAAHNESDLDDLDALQRVKKKAWTSHDENPHEADVKARDALKRAHQRKRRARGEAPAKAGRKPKQPKLGPLEAVRDDRELEAAAERARVEHTVAVDDLDLGVENFYAEHQSYEEVADDVYALAGELNRADIIAHGAQTTLPMGSNWKPAVHEESPNIDQPSTESTAASEPDPTDDENDPTFDV